MNQKSARIIATYFGLGLSKIAPGTMGSLGTLPLAYALIYFGGFWALMAAAAVLFVLGVRATEAVIEESGMIVEGLKPKYEAEMGEEDFNNDF